MRDAVSAAPRRSPWCRRRPRAVSRPGATLTIELPDGKLENEIVRGLLALSNLGTQRILGVRFLSNYQSSPRVSLEFNTEGYRAGIHYTIDGEREDGRRTAEPAPSCEFHGATAEFGDGSSRLFDTPLKCLISWTYQGAPSASPGLIISQRIRPTIARESPRDYQSRADHRERRLAGATGCIRPLNFWTLGVVGQTAGSGPETP